MSKQPSLSLQSLGLLAALLTGGCASSHTGTVAAAQAGAAGQAEVSRGDAGAAAVAASGASATAGGAQSASGGASATAGGAQSASGGASAGVSGTAPARCSTVSGSVAKALVEAGATLLDVREPSEFATNALPGAINIPLGSLGARLSELDVAKNIVTYCASGTRSSQAAAQLCSAGYNVYNLGARANWPQ